MLIVAKQTSLNCWRENDRVPLWYGSLIKVASESVVPAEQNEQQGDPTQCLDKASTDPFLAL
jgi:hypothetical protein